jgi:hypothetical protein
LPSVHTCWPFFPNNGGRARVLAKGKDTAGGDLRVAEHGKGDIAVVVARFGIVENTGHLLEVGWPEHKGDVAQGLVGEQSEGFGFHDKDLLSIKGIHTHVVTGDLAVLGFVRAEREWFLIEKGRRWHSQILY